MTSKNFLLVTGATGQIGQAVVKQSLKENYKVRVLARSEQTAAKVFEGLDVEIFVSNITDSKKFKKMLHNITHVCHCAARVGDWGVPSEYWQTNVYAFKSLLDACVNSASELKKFVHISSLGVYEPRDHFGTSEQEPIFKNGLDAYNQSKAIAEELLMQHKLTTKVGVIILRPGFVYGPGDRHVLPGVIESLKKKRFVFFDHGKHKLNNVSVFNVAEAVSLALTYIKTSAVIFNITDRELVTRKKFINTVADLMNLPRPTKSIPRPLGRLISLLCDGTGRLLSLKNPPLLSKARYKFLALNLEFSIENARKNLGYIGNFSFDESMRLAVESYRHEAKQ